MRQTPYALRYHPPRVPLLLSATLLLAPLVGCGYHTAGAATHIPGERAHSIAVPVFATHAQAYHTEMALTQAVVRELNTRTGTASTSEQPPTRMPRSAALC